MRKLHEEPQDHIHGQLCSEVNELIIDIKLHHIIKEPNEKVLLARSNRERPTWEDMVDMLTRVRDEMNQCTKPYRRY